MKRLRIFMIIDGILALLSSLGAYYYNDESSGIYDFREFMICFLAFIATCSIFVVCLIIYFIVFFVKRRKALKE